MNPSLTQVIVFHYLDEKKGPVGEHVQIVLLKKKILII